MANKKLKLLYLAQYLQEETDERHPRTLQDMIAYLERCGISAERKSLYDDLELLRLYGMDVQSVRGKSYGYFLGDREFQLPELKLLIDAVQSSRFLTEKKSRELIEKLCSQCNEQDARLMRRDVYVSGRVKSMNETIYYSVDAIQEAIAQNKQITFRYFDWGLNGTRVYRQKSYTASPYGLCQDNENCYLLALSPRHGITSYRVDRMSDIELAQEPRVPCPELAGRNLTEYANRMFQMYSGDRVSVKLRFRRELANVVIDRFGKDTMLFPDGKEHFVFTVEVAVSPLFLSWVMGFGDKAQILYPQSVVEECKKMARQVLEQYGG